MSRRSNRCEAPVLPQMFHNSLVEPRCIQNFEATAGRHGILALPISYICLLENGVSGWMTPQVTTSCFSSREQASATAVAAQSRTICVPCTNKPRAPRTSARPRCARVFAARKADMPSTSLACFGRRPSATTSTCQSTSTANVRDLG